jgi:DNA repair exonuclease SbcCD ATPase subunit
MDQITQLPIDLNKVDKIIHVADVHIRNYKRHDEYQEIFKKLYGEIEKRKTENTLIVVAGDVVHSKSDMSPELVDMVTDFLGNLADRCPTILTPGNHDCLENNPDRMDALSPVVQAMGHPNLFYVFDTGLYEVGDVVFAHFNFMDDPSKYPSANEIPEGKEKIAIYHDVVDQAVTDYGYTLESDEVNEQTFIGYDKVLLGDIHRRQRMSESRTEQVRVGKSEAKDYVGGGWNLVEAENGVALLEREWPEAHYPGSLIQQNHGEDVGHGFLVWDLDSEKPEYVELQNDYGFYTLKVESASLPVRPDISEKPRLRMKVKNTSGAEVRRLTDDVRDLYNIQKLSVMRVEDEDGTFDSGKETAAIGDLMSTSYQNSLITDYVQRNFPATDEVIDEIRNINEDLNKQLDGDDLVNNLKWKPKKFEFSNMFSYGENNVINFEKMGGIVGLFSENATGKSSILDALAFCLFDKSTRAYKTDQILNNNSDWFECKLTFEIDGDEYVIHRKGEKERDRIPVDVQFYRTKEDGTRENLNGEQRYDTNANIREYVGEYDDFILTALSVQNNNTLFIEKSQSERKDVLARFMGLNVFDELYSIAKDKSKHIKTLLEEHDKSELQNKIKTCKEKRNEKKSRRKEVKSKKADLENRKSDLMEDIMEINKKMTDIGEIDIDIDRMKKKYVSYREDEENLEKKLEAKAIRRRELEQAIQGLESYLEQFDGEALEKSFKDNKTLKNEIEKLETDLEYKSEDLEEAKEERDHLSHREFDPDCEYCVKRNEQDARKLEEVENEIEELSEKTSQIEEEIQRKRSKLNPDIEEEWKKFKKKRENKRKQEKKLSRVKIEHSDIQTKLRDKRDGIEEIEEKIQKYNEAEEKIEKNRKLENKADKLNDKLSGIKNEISDLQDEITDIHSDIRVLDREQEQAEKNLSKIEGLSTKYQAYEYYIESVKRDGVPYELISRFIPQIEQHINSILSQIVDFGVVLEVDGKNINAYIVYDEENMWALELGSGMEKFVSSLAIRAALIDVSNLPRPNFLAIDEGFGNLDTENMSSVYQLFEYLKTNFKFIMVISHIDVMRDNVDDLMEIEAGEYSSVMY